MAGESGQDWLELIYLFLAGLVSVAVEMIRRKAVNMDEEEDDRRRERRHRRLMEEEEHYHRRWDDPPENNDRGDEVP